jgi:hypothetical protein
VSVVGSSLPPLPSSPITNPRAHQQLPMVAALPLHSMPPAAMSVAARTNSERCAWQRAADRKSVVGRIARFHSGEGKEVRRGGGTGLPAGVDGPHAGGAQVEEDGEEGQKE